ncbi:hypothetical protein BX286_0192 [Streptomyces sp. 3211.6]|nr:hypothetical protein BX286_0192 [Streptomyces sp. 3211.6]
MTEMLTRPVEPAAGQHRNPRDYPFDEVMATRLQVAPFPAHHAAQRSQGYRDPQATEPSPLDRGADCGVAGRPAGCRRLHRRYKRTAEHVLAFAGIAAALICCFRWLIQ